MKNGCCLSMGLNFVSSAVGAVALAVLMVLVPAGAGAQVGQKIKIGMIVPVTGEGSYWGVNYLRGAKLALEEINARAGSGETYELVVEDDRCDSKLSVTAFQKLSATQGVKYFLGPVCSSGAMALAPLVARAKTPLIACSESSDIPNGGGYLYKIWIPNDRQGRALARFAIKKGHRAAVISIQNAYGNALSRAFREEFEKLGGEVTAFEEYDPATSDFRSMVLRVRGTNPDALVMSSYIPDGVNLLRQIKESGYQGMLLSVSTVNSGDFFKQVGDQAEGLFIADVKDTTSDEFRERWKREYKAEWPGITSCGAAGYDAMRLLAEALRSSHDPDGVRSALAARKDFPGVTGPITFDAITGSLTGDHFIFVVKGGKVVPYVE